MSYITLCQPRSVLNEATKIFDHVFSPLINNDTSNIETSHWIPAVDIKEDKTQFVIYADLPGINKENVNISMENNILTIKGTRAWDTKEERKDYFREERVRGDFHRRFTLPETADESKIEAKMKNGVLEIRIPKKEVVLARSIKIISDD